MRIEQVVQEPCALCTLVMQRAKLTKLEKLIYSQHLQQKHHVQPYYIPR
ncbi:MAG: hypothetical protein HYY68_03210 [Thaumarchaeota archaeon]|nr:hypothetical protein [Nitrososphaerota archaeon]